MQVNKLQMNIYKIKIVYRKINDRLNICKSCFYEPGEQATIWREHLVPIKIPITS